VEFQRLTPLPIRPLSPSRVPGFGKSHSLAFDRSRCVKSATSSGLDATPESSRPNQCPLAAVLLRQAPTTIVPLRCRMNFLISRVRLDFSRLSSVPIRSFSSLRIPVRCCRPSRHYFRSLRRCRPTAYSVCTQPLSLRVGKYPLAATIPAPGPYWSIPLSLLLRVRCSEPFDPSATDFPRGVSRCPSADFHLAALRAP